MKVSGGLRIEDDPLIRINIILKDKKIPLKKRSNSFFAKIPNQNECLS